MTDTPEDVDEDGDSTDQSTEPGTGVLPDGGEIAAHDPDGVPVQSHNESRESSLREETISRDQLDERQPPANLSADSKPVPSTHFGDPAEVVESHFSAEELARLRALASNPSTESAWVIKRLFCDPQE